jgi:hypothetical protein
VFFLVFVNVTHAGFVIVELKAEPFDAAHLGQLQFYVEWAGQPVGSRIARRVLPCGC